MAALVSVLMILSFVLLEAMISSHPRLIVVRHTRLSTLIIFPMGVTSIVNRCNNFLEDTKNTKE